MRLILLITIKIPAMTTTPVGFGVKLGILCGLTVTCALSAVFKRQGNIGEAMRAMRRSSWVRVDRLVPGLSAATLAVALIAVAAPADALALLNDPQVAQVEQHVISGQ